MNTKIFGYVTTFFMTLLFVSCLSSGGNTNEILKEPEPVSLNNETMALLLNTVFDNINENRILVTDDDLLKLQGAADYSKSLDIAEYSDLEKAKIELGDNTAVKKRIKIVEAVSLPDGKYTIVAAPRNLDGDYRVGNAGPSPTDFIIPITNQEDVYKYLDITNRELYGSECPVAGKINFDVVNGKNLNGIYYPIQITLSTDYKILSAQEWDKLPYSQEKTIIPPMTSYYKNNAIFFPRILVKVLSNKGEFLWSYYMAEKPSFPDSKMQPSFMKQ
jgi:hypothetical protein